MATKKISDLASAGALDGTELFETVQAASSFKVLLSAIATFIRSVLNADNLTSGTVPDARFPATLPAVSGTNLTNLDASDLASGTVPDARMPTGVIASVGGVYAQNVQNGDYTLVLSDAGKSIDKQSGGAGETITIPPNSGGGSVAFPVGTIICGDNDGGGTLTIAITTDTLEDSSGNVGSRVVADNGSWVIKKIASTKWRITGSGIS